MSDTRRELPEGIIASEHLGARVWFVTASSMQQLADLLAIVLGEHMDDHDELHVTYNAMQSGSRHHPGKPGLLLGRDPHTELFFEYSALVVLRGAAPQDQEPAK